MDEADAEKKALKIIFTPLGLYIYCGGKFFDREKYGDARMCYTEAIKILEGLERDQELLEFCNSRIALVDKYVSKQDSSSSHSPFWKQNKRNSGEASVDNSNLSEAKKTPPSPRLK